MLAHSETFNATPTRPVLSLFERLAAAQDGQVVRVADPAAVTKSVIRNLHTCLNAHAGGAPTRADWGLSDFTDLAMQTAQAAPQIAREIKQQIEAFEPRLRRVSVQHEPERERNLFMTACFRIYAELVFADQRTPLTLETQIRSNGSVNIK